MLFGNLKNTLPLWVFLWVRSMQPVINREQDYAIRIVAYLSTKGEELVSIRQLGERLYIPVSTTSKIVHRLTEKHLLQALRGRNGGVRIGRDASRISLLDILQAMGFRLQLNDCTGSINDCPLERVCKIHQFFMMEQQGFIHRLSEQMIRNFSFTDDDLCQDIKAVQ